jgi:hypothetical protein
METKTPKTFSTVKELGAVFNELVKQRKAWEAGTYAASNAELYSILGHTLDILYRVKRYTELSRGLNALLEERGYKFTDATSTETKLLRVVFAEPAKPDQYKQRVYVYARVLSVAFEAKVTGDRLPAFIAEHGGIDEIRRHDTAAASKSEKAKLDVHVAERALTVASAQAIASGITLTSELQPADGQHFSLALVRKDKDGTGSIVFGTNNVSLVRSVLGIAGRKIDEAAEDEQAQRRKAEYEAARHADIAAFADALASNTSAPAVHTSLNIEATDEAFA